MSLDCESIQQGPTDTAVPMNAESTLYQPQPHHQVLAISSPKPLLFSHFLPFTEPLGSASCYLQTVATASYSAS